tara:strand:- start:280 stop:1209 length:930 start_codon:yes stop_codon:yes gene_type:complete
MRKIFLVLLTFLMSLNSYSNVNAKLYRSGTIFENEIKFSNKFVLPVSKGKWEVINQYDFNYFFQFKGNSIVRLENNEVMEFIWIERANLTSYQNTYINNALNEIVFKDQYDGCYTRPEYYIVEVYSKGSTHNCLVIRHIDSNKELFTPDDPGAVNAQLKKVISDRSIIIPPIMFDSWHTYFSRLIRGEWYVIQYMANPKLFNSPKLNYLTEESSEFHKANISRYPEHKLVMEKWISVSAKRHREIEKLLKAKEHHLLNLDKYILENESNYSNSEGKNKIIEDLEQLNELYKSGVITKEEFKKAKDKILN